MHPWEDDRRRFAAIDEQNRVNEEMGSEGPSAPRSTGGLGYLAFMATVVFFKPIAECCIELYVIIASCVHRIGGLIGF